MLVPSKFVLSFPRTTYEINPLLYVYQVCIVFSIKHKVSSIQKRLFLKNNGVKNTVQVCQS